MYSRAARATMRIEVIMGSMFGGKTSRAIERASRLEAIGKRVLYVSPLVDDRDACLCTHDEARTRRCDKLRGLHELTKERANGFDVIVIDEMQFFVDVTEFVLRAERELPDALFIITCLAGDSERRSWTSVNELLPFADHIMHLTAYCSACGDSTPGPFSSRTAKREGKVVIGGAEAYTALCRMHFVMLNTRGGQT
jgi:thymidine kinase